MTNFDPTMCYDSNCDASEPLPHKRTTRCPNGPANRPLEQMTDREIAEETLYWLRQAGQALAAIQKGGVMSMMAGMFKGK